MATTSDNSPYFTYNSSSTFGEFTGGIDSYLSKNPTKTASGFFVASEIDLFKKFKEKDFGEYSIKEINSSEGFGTYSLKRTIYGEDGTREINGHFALVKTNRQDIYVTFTNSTTRFLSFCLKRFFEKFYPHAALIFLSSANLQKILTNVEAGVEDCELISKKVVAYAKIEEDYEIKGKQMIKLVEKKIREAEVKYTEEPFARSFGRAAEANAWIDKINYVCFVFNKERKNYRAHHEGYLSREGVFKVQSNFTFFVDNVLKEISEIAQDKYFLFRNRDRLKDNIVSPSKPLVVLYDYNVFENVSENKKLINAMDNLKFSSISVFHGNPYLHMALVDYLDGSSYDFWVLSNDRILITPQMKATFASLNRVLSHLFEKFREGKIQEFVVNKNG